MLPAVRTDQEWQAVVWDEQVVRPAAADLAARLGLAGAELRRYPDGTRPVYQVGGHRVLKLCSMISAPGSMIEARVLEYLHGWLPIATPELLACGDYEHGWRYLLMSQLPGTELAAAWPAIPAPAHDRIASQPGELLAALRGLDPSRCTWCCARPTGLASSPAGARPPCSASARLGSRRRRGSARSNRSWDRCRWPLSTRGCCYKPR